MKCILQYDTAQAYSGHGEDCGGLTENVPQKLMFEYLAQSW